MEFGKQPLPTIRHSALSSTRTLCDGKWKAIRCENCQLNCYALDAASSTIVLNSSMYRGRAIDRLRADPCFSTAFQVIVRSKPQEPEEKTHSKSLESYAEAMIDAEKVAMETRIHQFVLEQKYQYEQFRDHIMNELQVLSPACQDLINTPKVMHVAETTGNIQSNVPSPRANSDSSGWSSDRASVDTADDEDIDDEEDIFQLDEEKIRRRPQRRDSSDSESSDRPDMSEVSEVFNRTTKMNLSSSVPLTIPRALEQPRQRTSTSSSPDENSFMPPHTIADVDFYSRRHGTNSSRDDPRSFDYAVMHQSLSYRSQTML
jgi:hypothetical protein